MTIDPTIRTAYEAARPMGDKPFRSSCYAPYVSLYFNTNGDVVACCKNTTYVLGNVANERLGSIWKGRKVQGLRKALKDYQFGMGCQFCEWQIRGGQYDQVYTNTFDRLPVDSEAPEWPRMMEFTLSNTCNLACVMCYGVLSSTIRAFRERLPPLPQVYDERFFTDLSEFLPHLQVAKFFGGEPFLAQENFRVWDMMRDKGISIPCHVTTNATQYNRKVEEVLEAFPVGLSISIDGATKETVESVRVNAHFETIMENLDRFQAYSKRRGTYLSLTYCLMRQNWHEFGDYLQLAERRGLLVFVNTVIDPVHCSLYTLPPEELLQIADRMAAQDKDGRYSGLRVNGGVWQSTLAGLRKNASDRQVQGVSDLKEQVRKRKIASGQGCLDMAWQHIAKGEFAQALEEVRGIPTAHTDFYDGLVVKAHVLRLMNQLEAAEAAVGDAIRVWKHSPKPYLERAWLRSQQARHADALADAIRARGLLVGDRDPVEAGVMDALCFAHAYMGQHDEALQAANRLVALRGDAMSMVHRGWIHAMAGRWQEAGVDADAALELNPADTEAQKLKAQASTEVARSAGKVDRPAAAAATRTAPPPPGALQPFQVRRPAHLAGITTTDLMAELLARLEEGKTLEGDDGIALGDSLTEGLGKALDVHHNRFSMRRLHDLFAAFHRNVADPRPPIQGARYVDLGCGSHNPLGLLFLFQLLGARHGTGVDLDPVVDAPRALRAMARTVHTLLGDPRILVGDLPISRAEIAANLDGVNPELLRAGDARGLDWSKLAYVNSSVYATSLPDASADVVLSNSVLEHIEDLDRLIAETLRITAPGGFGVHFIDGLDHRSYSDSKVHKLGFLREPGTGFLHGSNRIRPLQFPALFERHGFVVQQFVPVQRIDVPPEVQASFASPWRELPRDLLEVVYGGVVVRKP